MLFLAMWTDNIVCVHVSIDVSKILESLQMNEFISPHTIMTFPTEIKVFNILFEALSGIECLESILIPNLERKKTFRSYL